MTTEADSTTPHAPQFYADFGPSIVSNQHEQLPPPPAYTSVPMPLAANITPHMKPSLEPAAVVNELVNQRFSPITQQQFNSQQILRITQYIDNQEKAMNDKLVTAICLAIFSIAVGLVCLGLAFAYHEDLCGYYQTSTSCIRIHSAYVIGSVSIFLGIVRMMIYCRMKMKISRARRLWQERVAQLQQTSVHGY